MLCAGGTRLASEAPAQAEQLTTQCGKKPKKREVVYCWIGSKYAKPQKRADTYHFDTVSPYVL